MKPHSIFFSQATAFITIIAAFMLLAAGCSNVEMSMPMGGVGKVLDSGKPYIDNVDAEVEEAVREQQFASALTTWKSQQDNKGADYCVGSGDVLSITIESLKTQGQISELEKTVPDDGNIEMPLIGLLQVKGLTCKQIAAQMADAYRDKYLKDPQILVEVSDYHSLPVVMTGAVARPGIYYLRQNISTILEVLFLAGGVPVNAGDKMTVIRDKPDSETKSEINMDEQPEMITIDLKDLIANGNMALNLPIYGGDVITINHRQTQYAYILGYVQNPGAIAMPAGYEEIGALELLARAGGVTSTARAQNCFILIERPEGRKVVNIDLTKIANGVRPTVYLQSGDTLIVGSSAIAKLSEFIRPSATMGVSATSATGL